MEVNDKIYTEQQLIDAMWNALNFADKSFAYQKEKIEEYIQQLKAQNKWLTK